MSRHLVEPKQPNTTVAVGWDRPMRTFFGQVHRTDLPEDEDDLVFWVGGGFDDLKNVYELKDAIEPYADLSQDMIEQLETDKATK